MIASTLVTFAIMLAVIAENPTHDAQPICLKLYPAGKPALGHGKPGHVHGKPAHVHLASVDSGDSPAQRRSLELEEHDEGEHVLKAEHHGKEVPGKEVPGKEGHGKSLRFKTTAPVEWLNTDQGPCGPYKTETIMGACLWQGTDPTGGKPEKAGWLDGSSTKMCRKELSVARAGKPTQKITVKIIDTCDFKVKQPKAACNQIFLTKMAFDALKPTPAESEKGSINNLIWDFKEAARPAH
ncbi:hypothetical protein DFH28DRAFT_539394 [Melampsora americana]|nr:hypothetical protein DFH28DRAFT_539394 [Melampsora americana]